MEQVAKVGTTTRLGSKFEQKNEEREKKRLRTIAHQDAKEQEKE